MQDVKSRLDQGNSLYMQGKYNEAIIKYQEVLDVNPNNSQCLYNLGNSLRRLGRNEEAIEKYRRALEFNPNISQAYNNWGLALSDLGKYEDAISKYSKAVEVNLTFSQAYNNWGVALDALGRHDEASSKYKKAIDLNLNYSEAYYNWGNALFHQKDYENSISKYREAVDLNPRYAQAYHNWGVVLSAREEYDEAIKKFSKTIEIDPFYSDAYNNWALILYDQRKYSEAVQIVAKGIKALSNHPGSKAELIKLFNNQINQDEQNLMNSQTEAQRNDLKEKIANIKQILDMLRDEPKVNLTKKVEPPKEPVIEQKPMIKLPSSPEIIKEPSQAAAAGAGDNLDFASDQRVAEYYNFLREELDVLFSKTFTLKGGKLEERADIVLPCLTFATGFLPSLYDVAFDEKVFPLISKIAPDGVSLEDVFIIRKVNKIYQQFIAHFTTVDEVKQLINRLAKELAVQRKDRLIADYKKAVNPKSMNKLKQAKARDFLSKYNISSKSEEFALLDIGILVIMFFLEGLRVEEYTNSAQKINNITKATLAAIKEYYDEMYNDAKTPSEWCNVM